MPRAFQRASKYLYQTAKLFTVVLLDVNSNDAGEGRIIPLFVGTLLQVEGERVGMTTRLLKRDSRYRTTKNSPSRTTTG